MISEKLQAHLAAIIRYVLDTEEDCFCDQNPDGSLCVKHHAAAAQELLATEEKVNVNAPAHDDSEVLSCEYVTVWDGGTEIRTPAKYYKAMRDVETEAVEANGLDSLDEEYIEFIDGTRINRFDADGNEAFNV
jgi:hypothetical protein